MLHLDGENCDDNNVQTINDKYLNGICTGKVYSCNNVVFETITPDNPKNGFVPTFVSLKNDRYISYNGLFDGIRPNEWDTDRVSYWESYGQGYLKLSFDKPFRIWRSGTQRWSYDYSELKIYDSNNNLVSGKHIQTKAITNLEWEVFTTCIEPGTYSFAEPYANNGRIDSEWFVESGIIK